jgi:hypothetical protein
VGGFVKPQEWRVGTVYELPPEPPDDRATTWLEAGVLEIGVEWRDVSPEALQALYAHDHELLAALRRASPEGGFTDRGISLHVRGVADGYEYLRFDAFEDEPHYHYIHRVDGVTANRVVMFDTIANGDMLTWAFECLRYRAAEMLRVAGAARLADDISPDILADAVDQIAVLVQQTRSRMAS